METIITTAIVTLGSVAVPYFGYRGLKYTRQASVTANAEEVAAQQQAQSDEQEQKRFRQAWPELLDSVRTELVEPLREELDRERQARKALAKKVDEQGDRITSLSSEVTRWRRTARALARWGVTLRQQVIALGGTAPADPDELELLHAIEDTRYDG